MTFHPCVVVPVYNHGAGARALAERLDAMHLPVIMVNDGSTPDCTAELRGLAQRYDWLEVLEHSENQGKGGAVLSGLRQAYARGYSHALQIDADGQHDPNDIPRFLEIAEHNPAALIAGQPQFDASAPKGRFVARYLTHVWVWIETLSFAIRDSMCGFRVYPLEQVIGLADSCRLGKRMDFDPEVMVRLHWLGVEILSLPTKVVYPADGQSGFRLVLDNVLITRMHVRLVFGMLWRAPMLLYRRATS